ncbi:MAG TPA: type III PLP-dependent enzyme [Candidatus Eisenbacteria bacterium]|nr:type III PLP-dependent enzyme [Candidatus Eisenbacteria bacterium]
MNEREVKEITRRAAGSPTPAYYYHSGSLRRCYRRLAAFLPSGFEILFSVKANPHASVLGCFRRLGAGADVASEEELRRALRAGFPPARISFAGPGKNAEELRLAVAKGVTIQAESEEELIEIDKISARLGRRAVAGIRVNPALSHESDGMRMGGGPKPFGIDEERLPAVVSRLAACRHLTVGGIHVFSGSQILDGRVLAESFADTWRIAVQMRRRLGRGLAFVNFGGGFGLPYFAGERPLDLAAFGRRLRRALGGELAAASRSGTRFWVESGRYLAGEAGVYVTKVLYKKISRGRTYLITDGGMNHHLPASGNFGTILKKNYPIRVLGARGRRSETVTIAGPLCTPLDVLGRDVRLPAAGPGDLVGIFQSGAYGLTASPSGFLSRRPPREALL